MREYIYGRQAVAEALRAGRRTLFKLILAEGIQIKGVLDESLALARQRGIPPAYAPRAQLDKLTPDHQGVLVEVSPYPYAELETMLAGGREHPLLLLVLDRVQDPQNVGVLLRTAEASGVDGVIVPRHRAACITPAVVNASSGAVEHLRIAQVTNVTRSLEKLKDADVWVAGLENWPEAQVYTQADLTGPLALVVGSEGLGLSRLVRQTCDFLIKLPMQGQVSSLNAAVAGSIALYEILRQRRQNVGQKSSNGS